MYVIVTFLIFVSSVQKIANKEICSGYCADKTCISRSVQCDGKADCLDGTDETKDVCKYENCKARFERSFQCDYGACVSLNATCDGVKDCVDNSDELLAWCPRVTDGKFDCDANNTIGLELVCDSRKDCPDGSDETADLCGKLICDDIKYQCTYGACISFRATCDGKMDCVDGSDETVKSCRAISCREGQFRCGYGACVPVGSLCDGTPDCVDRSDENQPWCPNVTDGKFKCQDGGFINHTSICNGIKDCSDGSDETESLCTNTICNDRQFQCKYGACISNSDVCNAKLDCFDGSDETEERCRENLCTGEQFRCQYGGCVSRKARCNGVRDCVDNSDELLPWCSEITDGKFKCINKGVYYQSTIDTELICDGLGDCGDQSDETESLCGNNTCHAKQFRCGYGACIPLSLACDGRTPGPDACTDESDESFEVCGKSRCFFPTNPDNGRWNNIFDEYFSTVNFYTLTVKIECDEGFGVLGNDTMSCTKGVWSNKPPKCVRYCTLPIEPSVTYRCSGPESDYTETRACRARELSGALALPSCNGPNFYATQALPHMTCVDGTWDYMANCTIECGTVTPDAKPLISGGYTAKHGELPWHAAIYRKLPKINRYICGGSLLNYNVVISAAHCFWGYDIINKKFVKQPAEDYAVAVGMVYRRWNHPKERNAQRTNVSELIIPNEFDGEDRNYHADIAVVIVSTPFEYKPYIRPVCLSFDPSFESLQMASGKQAKVAGWGLTGEDERESPILKVIDLPYIEDSTCSETAPQTFKQYLTLDKFCVGFLNKGVALCKGDSGGGAVFSNIHEGVERFFLRGVVSVAPQNNHKCNVNVYTAMTRLSVYENFVKKHY